MSYRDKLIDPVAQLTYISYHLPDRFFPERMLSLAAYQAVTLHVFVIFATRTGMLQADEIGYV